MPEVNTGQVIVRIPPSPTGFCHLGTARTALFNYLFARKNNGKFIFRIEDTDLERSKKEYERDLIESFKWLGLEWDEGPYRQSERTKIYGRYIAKLLELEQVFWCAHTKEELEKEKEGQMAKKLAPRHTCDNPLKEKPKNKHAIIRFRAPEKKIVFDDLIRGSMEFDGGLFGDLGIAKDEHTPLYNLAVVIDDIEMKVSHIIRGEDHLSNTPKQILLYEAFGASAPHFAHLPMILGSDRSKMSKRHGAVSVSWYREQGYLPGAMVNFMALLGWNPGTEKEIFSMPELIKEFSLERVQKGGAVFNPERLNWFNAQYIKKMDLDDLTKACLPYLAKEHKKEIDVDFAKKIVALERERIKKLSEIAEMTRFFFRDELAYKPELLIWKETDIGQIKKNLQLLEKVLSQTDSFEQESLEALIMPLTKEYGAGELLWPLRVALTGRKASPGPFAVMAALGKEKSLERIKQAIVKIQ